jgi:hypothetical protein
MNLYRITLRDKDGKISHREAEAASLHLALDGPDELYEIVKIKRTRRLTRKVRGGIYNDYLRESAPR